MLRITGFYLLCIYLISAIWYSHEQRKNWELFFTVYEHNNHRIEHIQTGGMTRDDCIEKSFGEHRDNIKRKYPNAAIAGHCQPRSWLKSNLKQFGWH